jgi:hypothetical protein
MKNFLLGAVFGAVAMGYLTGNITAEGITFAPAKPSSPTDPPVKPPTVVEPQPPTNPPTAA